MSENLSVILICLLGFYILSLFPVSPFGNSPFSKPASKPQVVQARALHSWQDVYAKRKEINNILNKTEAMLESDGDYL